MNNNFSPHDLLPIKYPLTNKEPRSYFYNKVIKYLIPDIIRIANNGTPIDLNKVKELDDTVTNILNNNSIKLKNNPIIKMYLHKVFVREIKDKISSIKNNFLTIDKIDSKEFIFDIKNINYRSYIINYYLKNNKYDEYILNKWSYKDIKLLSTLISSNFINDINNKTLDNNNYIIKEGMISYIKDKIKLYNIKKVSNIKTYINKLKETLVFNPNSSTQKNELFTLLNIDIEEKTPTGMMKTSRTEIGKVLDFYLNILKNKEDEFSKNIVEILQVFIDQSNSSIIKNNFIKSFYLYTVNSVLYSSLKLFGTKTFRNTSSHPNLLNMPSTGNIYSKPFKKCLIAPEGFLIYTVDLSALKY